MEVTYIVHILQFPLLLCTLYLIFFPLFNKIDEFSYFQAAANWQALFFDFFAFFLVVLFSFFAKHYIYHMLLSPAVLRKNHLYFPKSQSWKLITIILLNSFYSSTDDRTLARRRGKATESFSIRQIGENLKIAH